MHTLITIIALITVKPSLARATTSTTYASMRDAPTTHSANQTVAQVHIAILHHITITIMEIKMLE